MSHERVADKRLWEVKGERRKMSTERFQEGFHEEYGIWAWPSRRTRS